MSRACFLQERVDPELGMPQSMSSSVLFRTIEVPLRLEMLNEFCFKGLLQYKSMCNYA